MATEIHGRNSDLEFESVKKPRFPPIPMKNKKKNRTSVLKKEKKKKKKEKNKEKKHRVSSPDSVLRPGKERYSGRCMEDLKREELITYFAVKKKDYVVPFDREGWAKYHKQLEETEGFDMDVIPAGINCGSIIRRIDDRKPGAVEEFKAMAVSAIENFNKANGTEFGHVQVDKVNQTNIGQYQRTYITFTARDVKNIAGNDSDEAAVRMTFQALLEWHPRDNLDKVLFCRRKP